MRPSHADSVFTLNNGKPITKGLINYQVEKAVKAGVTKFRFYAYRHSTLTSWARRQIYVDTAMVAAGHRWIVMHRRYTHLQDTDIADAFGCDENTVTRKVIRKRTPRRK